eukprot:CAMPEP_0180440184 /NCGR_PEP_ID=MMETSP1036_2-20121128/12975_1 /TAXON_ID=632150 /ORGANISM="Azadinium spinosum, Strain 3D9" /LENGTH=126 /DNA_ID=CAMNT_0022446351 /DNA_START=932 /DNA_END=1312 /DNA_ORIENTATION=+
MRGLHLGGNQMINFPDSFWELGALQNLQLNNNRMRRLPDKIGHLKALRGLDLGGNQLSTLPDSFCELTALEHLMLDYSQLRRLPAGIGRVGAFDMRAWRLQRFWKRSSAWMRCSWRSGIPQEETDD